MANVVSTYEESDGDFGWSNNDPAEREISGDVWPFATPEARHR